ncbi:SDR family NAD(P)-dependent oxidoreductase [Sulfuriferula nivalis]|uniref:Oxidoreductase n=1 Tax=Sulfuriferula nivalis TaxID=2675298 RepID=A0A809RGB1_9PROT|nr:SDR family NAD(P)-dependent oxidoreductase [Sulfuriferula nivalis]BBP00899.1 oxidoreductase [Sulfuriferula nivalis]
MSLNAKIRNWDDKVVWITGASSGIGAALAQQFISLGARVIVSSRHLDTMPHAYVIACDTTNVDSLNHAAAEIRRIYGQLDLIIANAGNHTPMHADSIDMAAATALINTNFTGTVNTVATALPILKIGGGIAVVASVAGYRGLPTGLIYGATKAALINFTETLYLDLVPKGYSVYLINPGFVKTPLTDKNAFAMPALITADAAASAIITGMEHGDFEIHFPKKFTRIMKLLRYLPYRVYFWLIHKGTGL